MVYIYRVDCIVLVHVHSKDVWHGIYIYIYTCVYIYVHTYTHILYVWYGIVSASYGVLYGMWCTHMCMTHVCGIYTWYNLSACVSSPFIG